MQKKCPICGKVFETHVARKLYCSPECKKKGIREYKALWREKNREHFNNYQNEYIKKWRKRKKIK